MIHYMQHLTIVYVSPNKTLKDNMNILPTFWGLVVGRYKAIMWLN